MKIVKLATRLSRSCGLGVRHMAGVGHNTLNALLSAAALVSGAFIATSAEARYSAIDGIGTEQVRYSFYGYCDRHNGQECDYGSTYILPYTVSFGGEETNRILLASDGRIHFVNSNLKNLETIDTGLNVDSPAPKGETALIPQIASIGSARISYEYRFVLGQQFPPPPPDLPPPVIYALTSEIITASWFACRKPFSNCLVNIHSVTLTPNAQGFEVVYGGINAGKAGHQLMARFDAGVPEPSTWAMMIIGFAAAGSMIRRRKAVIA